jgi:hypothetical protein
MQDVHFKGQQPAAEINNSSVLILMLRMCDDGILTAVLLGRALDQSYDGLE